ncbi:hypothetical protein CVT26_010498 [Gymnopilus dilepis]|uniref:Uncharacterized protein n=1 Tax=Gymnopilus dilepis TaxID=231916 RepID=A0A409W500_9AGAR|nr:hypothetical protein CVT26_010498 [Gymnopilus dilepis]
MLLRFTSPDMLNTGLVDVSTNRCAYDIVTISLQSEESSSVQEAAVFPSPEPSPVASSSQRQSPLKAPSEQNTERRQTIVTAANGTVVANIIWTGRRPDITLLDEKVGALTDLFGSSTVRFMPKVLAIPTRFDTEYIWTATPDSLTLFDYDTEKVKGTFYQNVVRIPFRPKLPRCSLSSPSKAVLSETSSALTHSASSVSLRSGSSKSVDSQDLLLQAQKSAFLSTHVPGLGSNYLEFTSHPLAHDIEIIISFLMMEILRRGRFNLPPYTFSKPKVWQEARSLFMRRLRRNTV